MRTPLVTSPNIPASRRRAGAERSEVPRGVRGCSLKEGGRGGWVDEKKKIGHGHAQALGHVTQHPREPKASRRRAKRG
ncbi:MAG: hypothetical protein ACODAU_00480, partial [Myxococcota bacterium]